MKTEMCKFFLANKCGKGSQCQFAHTASEIREKPDLNCTSMCRKFLQTGTCDTPNCSFAHSERELRMTAGFFKTKMCRFASSGRCRQGNACRFAHSQSELAWQQDGGGSTFSEDTYMGNFSQPGLAYELGTDRDSNIGGSQHDSSFEQGSMMSSSQSTRAETSASVSTPEGSGDSGQEEFLRGGQRGGQGDARGHRAGRRVQERHCTTVMITNVPNFLTQGALISLLEDLTHCMRGAYDFFYCPWDPCHDCNLGYAIVNFFSRLVAAEFERQWTNQPLLPKSQHARLLKIIPAALQGRAANLRHFSSFSLAENADPRFRPLVRAQPHEALKPMITSREVHTQPRQPMPKEPLYPEEDSAQESPRGGILYKFNPEEMPMLPGGGCRPFVPMMPTAMQFGKDGMVSGGVSAPSSNMARSARMSGGSQHREQDPKLLPATVPQCMGWWLPGAGPEGMAGAFPSSPTAVGAVPYFPQAFVTQLSMSRADGPMYST
jgi:hypothetical protein